MHSGAGDAGLRKFGGRMGFYNLDVTGPWDLRTGILLVICWMPMFLQAAPVAFPPNWSVANADSVLAPNPTISGSGYWRTIFPSEFGSKYLGFVENSEGFSTLGVAIVPPGHGFSHFEVVWSANRNTPVGKNATLSLSAGNLVLRNNDTNVVWSTNVPPGKSIASIEMQDDGNLVLRDADNRTLWESFKYPTDTIVLGQELNYNMALVASSSSGNGSEGNYRMVVESEALVLYTNLDSSSKPQPYWISGANNTIDEIMRSNDTSTKSYIQFQPNANHVNALLVCFRGDTCETSWFGGVSGNSICFLRLDPDGVLRWYYFEDRNKKWIQHTITTNPCLLPAHCGPYGICGFGGSCTCPRGETEPDPSSFHFRNRSRPEQGCSPTWNSTLNTTTCSHIPPYYELQNVSYIPNKYLRPSFENVPYSECAMRCLYNCSCAASFFWNTSEVHSKCFHVQDLLSMYSTTSMASDALPEIGGQYYAFIKYNQEPYSYQSFSSGRTWILYVIIVSSVMFSLILFLCCAYYVRFITSKSPSSETSVRSERTQVKEEVYVVDRLAFGRRKETGLRAYLTKVLRVLFLVFGLITIVLSVLLDNSFNDRPLRFIPFGILAPFTIFFGFLASGWFPRIPLRFIAFLKGYRFLRHVRPCSPWHDNVLTDFSGRICTLKPMELADQGSSQLPQVLQNFLYCDLEDPQEPQNLDCQEVCTSDDPQNSDQCQEFSTLDPHSNLQGSGDTSGTLEPDHRISCQARQEMNTMKVVNVTRSQLAPSQVQETVATQANHSSRFKVADHGRNITFSGPEIYKFPLEIQVLKNTSLQDSFDLCCTFRNERTRRMYLDTRKSHNLAQNMLRWVENPYPVVVEESSDILHCMPIQDILWAFTKGIYTFKVSKVKNRFLGCLRWEEVKQYALVAFIAATSMTGLIPLISDKRSLYFLFLAVPILAYIFVIVTGRLITYYFRSLLCPMFIRLRGFNELYRCKSYFTWCNEFRKQRVVNPAYFFIEQEYANRILDDGESCFNICGVVRIPPNSSPKESSPITFTCRGRPIGDQQKGPRLHRYRLVVKFDGIEKDRYVDVKLFFYENDDLLDSRYLYGSTNITVERLNLVETLFSYYSDPAFGGYVETIDPCFRSYLAHCPRFLDVCKKILKEETIPTISIAARKPESKLVIGDSSYL